jgi:hypothetical protein
VVVVVIIVIVFVVVVIVVVFVVVVVVVAVVVIVVVVVFIVVVIIVVIVVVVVVVVLVLVSLLILVVLLHIAVQEADLGPIQSLEFVGVYRIPTPHERQWMAGRDDAPQRLVKARMGARSEGYPVMLVLVRHSLF